MPNPNQINFASNEATDTHESLDQTPKEIKEERGEKTLGNYDRFKHLSREELMQIQPEDLPKEQLPAFIAASPEQQRQRKHLSGQGRLPAEHLLKIYGNLNLKVQGRHKRP